MSATSPSPPAEPPWRMRGESVAAFVRPPAATRRELAASLPSGVRMLPAAPAVLVGVAYQDSPVGPFHELSLGVVGRIGPRLGLCVMLQVVDSADARRVYREHWGLPTVQGTFLWSHDAAERSVRWEERGVVVRTTPRGPRLPMGVPTRSVQRRADGPVVLPRRMWCLVQAARSSVEVAEAMSSEEVDLTWLEGAHAGVMISHLRTVASVARHPTGLFSTLRAPAAGAAAEPAMTAAGVRAPTGRVKPRGV